MGLFDKLTGTRRPDDGVPPRAPQEVVDALLAVNAPDAPYAVRPGEPEGVDLVGEWRVAEVAWQPFFARGRLDRTFRILMRLDPTRHEVRTVDEQWTVTWLGDRPTFVAASVQRGSVRQVSAQWTSGAGGGPEQTVDFSSERLKEPLRAAVVGAGWTWRTVVAGKL